MCIRDSGQLALVFERVAEHLPRRPPRGAHLGDRGQPDLGAAREDVVHQNLRMVLLLAELHGKPVGDALISFGCGIDRHGEVEVGRPEFGIDLRIERFE